ncbi:nuclear transport factor 2 family protein [Micromonospora costi]|uniref:Nuclear transport factor 2 family protein n=1 Tax=Micromonospora costi TaxID=1530042 RepID=A0A3A9ZUZ6_9ACTN|nr:nuclear transport factor 2 family protein [Micromonospora costi]RKN52023.1 nuclear transport factor 2 family protein [Micromonospora costi]
MTPAELAERTRRLTDLYAAFNARDLPSLMAALAADVCWPNGWEGGIVQGRDAVAAYWQRQWAQIDPRVEPTAFGVDADGRVAVTVHQVVRDSEGAILVDHTVTHLYRFAGTLVAEMEIRE